MRGIAHIFTLVCYQGKTLKVYRVKMCVDVYFVDQVELIHQIIISTRERKVQLGDKC